VGHGRQWDAAMVTRIKAGDDSALAAVYDQYSALVHGIALTLVGPEQARDITQEVFLRIWQQPAAYDPAQGSLRTFLAVMARRRAIDELRRSGRRAAREQRVETETPTMVPNVEEAALAMVASDRLRAAVARLPSDQRRAIELAYFEGLTFRDVARVTGMPEGTAKSRLRLGLGRLAKELVAELSPALGEPRWT
jgi:RNA polymerase sigma-70 factor, ECF subfamily